MKKMFLMLLLLAGFGSAAMAAAEDTDGDGVYSMEEMKAAYPDITDEIFGDVDSNGDGSIDPEELAAAEAAGILTAG